MSQPSVTAAQKNAARPGIPDEAWQTVDPQIAVSNFFSQQDQSHGPFAAKLQHLMSDPTAIFQIARNENGAFGLKISRGEGENAQSLWLDRRNDNGTFDPAQNRIAVNWKGHENLRLHEDVGILASMSSDFRDSGVVAHRNAKNPELALARLSSYARHGVKPGYANNASGDELRASVQSYAQQAVTAHHNAAGNLATRFDVSTLNNVSVFNFSQTAPTSKPANDARPAAAA